MSENSMCSCILCGFSTLVRISIPNSPRIYYQCLRCDLRFLDPQFRLNTQDEKNRYLQHNNDVSDPAYQQFVRPLLDEILKRTQPHFKGLDFGAGTGPVLTELLKQNGYEVQLYDPLFWPDLSVLENKYNFIFACEVVEHFYDPLKEFTRLKSMLEKNGFLAIRTSLFDSSIDFQKWQYRNDPTHVAFYSIKTIQWIAKAFEFSNAVVNGSIIIFETKNLS